MACGRSLGALLCVRVALKVPVSLGWRRPGSSQSPEAPDLPSGSEAKASPPQPGANRGQTEKGPIRENHPNSYLALLGMGPEPQQGAAASTLAHREIPPVLTGGINT